MNLKFKVYADSLRPILKWISENPNDKDMKYVVNRMIRYSLDNPKMTGVPFMYSLGALDQAKRMGLDKPEERFKWTRWKEQLQKKGLNDIGRKDGIFHQEHIIPVSQIAKKLYDIKDITTENIYTVLSENTKIAWILKEEQKTLDSVNRTGLRTPEELTNLNILIVGFNHA